VVWKEKNEELSPEIKADERYAQILIKIPHPFTSMMEVKRIIEDLDIRIIKKVQLSPFWVLIKLNVKDMRDAALKLTEHGFTVKGINALP
jgi:hypothetical protein